MSHYNDLREVYAKKMEFHGYGYGLYHPVAVEDLRVPCCGFFDRNGDWNLICNLTTTRLPPEQDDWVPLEYLPQPTTEIGIDWEPKTSLGTQEHVLSGSAETPNNQPAGAEAQVSYTSKSKFGAVLMTHRGITLKAYNDERLFLAWLENNKKRLYELHGTQLKRYGMWIVTRTYSWLSASINAWSDNNKSAVISTKAKAAMLGELGEEVDWADKLSSRDWSRYSSKTKEGIVVFIDGIDMSPMDWKMEGFKQGVANIGTAAVSPVRSSPTLSHRSLSTSPPTGGGLAIEVEEPRSDSLSPPEPSGTKRITYPGRRPLSGLSDSSAVDEGTLRDVGMTHQLSRSASPALHVSGSAPRSPSLRHENRRLSKGSDI